MHCNLIKRPSHFYLKTSYS